jgi:hypothetical protein
MNQIQPIPIDFLETDALDPSDPMRGVNHSITLAERPGIVGLIRAAVASMAAETTAAVIGVATLFTSDGWLRS